MDRRSGWALSGAGGCIVSMLEGGYHLDALGARVAAYLGVISSAHPAPNP